jgi:leucyl aminopeptidase (aminopeptidase T)
MNCTSSNGRVDILGPNTDLRFSMTDRIPINEASSFRDAMTGNWNNTALSDAFFSAQNIKMIQNGIRAGVYKKSNGNYIIGEQSYDELKIVMRSIFLQNSKNLAINIPQQIEDLNTIVLKYTIHQVYGEADGYMKYKIDASTLVVPLAMPILSYSNDKQLELKPWF